MWCETDLPVSQESKMKTNSTLNTSHIQEDPPKYCSDPLTYHLRGSSGSWD